MKKIAKALFPLWPSLWVLLLLTSLAPAQDALVVTTCGTLPTPYSVGSSRLMTVDVNGKLCLSSATGGGVTSISNSDGTLTISPTTGAVIASINLAHANAWAGQQTFVAPILGTPASVTLTNATGLPISTGVSGLGTGVATALGNTAGGAGGFALVGTTPPTGTAGGSLKGTYPNPSLADVNAIATSLAIGGATIGSNALAVTGTALITGQTTFTGNTIYSLDNLYDIGASAATRPRNLFVATNGTFGGAVSAGGNVTGNNVNAGTSFSNAAGGYYTWVGRSVIRSTADGLITLSNQAETSFTRLLFGGTTSGFVALGTSATTATLQLADGTAGGTLAISGTGDAASATGGALQVSGGASVAKRFWIPAITASAGLQTAVLCQSSGGEMIADSVACLASSEKFKEDITASDMGLATVLALKPIVYRYRETGNARFDSAPNQRAIHAGFSAEQAASVDPRLVAYDIDGNVRTIRPDAVPAALVLAVQELTAKVERLEAR